MLIGDLKYHLNVQESPMRFHAAQVLLGLEHINYDLKLGDVLVDENGHVHVKISDLGLLGESGNVRGYAR